jgi:hypothetical protein
MTLKRSRGGHKAAQTALKRKLKSARQPRFPRLPPKELVDKLTHWIATDQIRWTPELVRAVIEHAGKQGVSVGIDSGTF